MVPKAVAATTQPTPKPRCHSVLIVEDDADIRDALRQVLELEGFKVACASNGREGLDVLASLVRPCLILLDLMMPVMNGWEFIEAQREDDTLATIPVIVISAVGDRAKTVPARQHLKKPIDLPSLLQFVHSYCDNEPAEKAS